MAEVEVELEAVLQFFRKNALSGCESALMEDIMEKSQVGSSVLEKFCFPMVPPPPPLKIPATRRPPPPQFADGGGGSPKGSSDDEFVSLGSSTTELYSSGRKIFLFFLPFVFFFRHDYSIQYLRMFSLSF